MLTVVTPAQNRRLTTVDAVKTDLGITGNTPSNGQIERLIDQATSAIEGFCNRIFARETVRETFDRAAADGGLILSRFPAGSFTSVTTGGNALLPANYTLDGTILYRLGANGYTYPWGPGLAVVEYTGGFALRGDADYEAAPNKLPAILERACILEIQAMRSGTMRDPMLRSQSADGVGQRSWHAPAAGAEASGLANPGIAPLLDPYRNFNL